MIVAGKKEGEPEAIRRTTLVAFLPEQQEAANVTWWRISTNEKAREEEKSIPNNMIARRGPLDPKTVRPHTNLHFPQTLPPKRPLSKGNAGPESSFRHP